MGKGCIVSSCTRVPIKINVHDWCYFDYDRIKHYSGNYDYLKEGGKKMYKFIKRLFDVCFCLIMLPFFAILYIIIGIAIKMEDGGPVFYKSKRIGKDLKVIDMYKFRSMKTNAPMIINDDGSTYNSAKDDRVTKIGRFIRETSLDEIPQILNVLKGDMSIVGPRASTPFDDGSHDFLPDEIDKVKVKPGITGYTQAYYRNNASVRDKRLMDAWYANNYSLWLDIKILFRTVYTVLKHENLYTNEGKPEENNNVIENCDIKGGK